MAVRFYLDKSKVDKRGDYPIRVSISINGVRFHTTAGFSISEDKWESKDQQQVKRGCSNAKGVTHTTINAKLKEIDAYFAGIEIDIQRKTITINRKDEMKKFIKDQWDEKFAKKKLTFGEKEKTFFSFWDEFVAEKSKEDRWHQSMLQKYSTLKKHIKDFNKDITIDYFNKEGLHEFVEYLLDPEKYKKSKKQNNIAESTEKRKEPTFKGMRNTTIKNRLSILKRFLRWAYEEGYHDKTAFQSFSPKLKAAEYRDNTPVYLSWDELIHIYNFPIPESKKYLDRVRDTFCFGCFTGLRYSDIYNLKRNNITDIDIKITALKTATPLTIQLNNYSKEILKKYEKEQFPYNKALPVISNQRSNEYLKELGKLCGIDEPVARVYFKGNERIEEVRPKFELIGTHTGRRTFITNALIKNIPETIVRDWTGHSTQKAMEPYRGAAKEEVKAKAMELFNKKTNTTMKEEFTTKMHSELHVSPEIEKLHRCITLWCYTGIESEEDPRFLELCKTYDLEPDFAISKKTECQALAGKTNNQ